MSPDELAKISLIAGLRLYGIGHDTDAEAKKQARKWKIDLSKFNKVYEGLSWHYPEEFTVYRLSEFLDPEDAWCMFSGDFEYTFKLNGQGFDTAAGGDVHFLSPEIMKVPGPTYTYSDTDWLVAEVVYDLDPKDIRKFRRLFKWEMIDGNPPKKSKKVEPQDGGKEWVDPSKPKPGDLCIFGDGKPAVSHGFCQEHYDDWKQVIQRGLEKGNLVDRDQYIAMVKAQESIPQIITRDTTYLRE